MDAPPPLGTHRRGRVHVVDLANIFLLVLLICIGAPIGLAALL
jgi:hypothetical protein